MKLNKELKSIIKYLRESKHIGHAFKKLGFEKLNPYSRHLGFPIFTESSKVYISKKYVIKKNYTTGKKPRLAVPTKVVSIKGVKYFVQPKCKIINSEEDYEKLCIHFKDGYGKDPHKNNVGFYRNKLVAFDW